MTKCDAVWFYSSKQKSVFHQIDGATVMFRFWYYLNCKSPQYLHVWYQGSKNHGEYHQLEDCAEPAFSVTLDISVTWWWRLHPQLLMLMLWLARVRITCSYVYNTQPCIGRKTQCNKFCRGVSLRLIWKQVYWKNCIHVIFIFIDCLPVLLCGDFSSMTGAPSVALGSDQSDHQHILLEYFMATTAWKTRLLVLNTKGIPILAVCFNIHIYYRNCVFLFMSKTMSRK